MMNWHGSVGIWLTVALVFISLTGLTWSTFAGSRFDTVLTALDARTPKLATTSVPRPSGTRRRSRSARPRRPRRPPDCTAR